MSQSKNKTTSYPSLPTLMPPTDVSTITKYSSKASFLPSFLKGVKRQEFAGRKSMKQPTTVSFVTPLSIPSRPKIRRTKPSSADSRSSLSLPPPLSPPQMLSKTSIKQSTLSKKSKLKQLMTYCATKRPLKISCGLLIIILMVGFISAFIMYISRMRELEYHTAQSVTFKKRDDGSYLTTIGPIPIDPTTITIQRITDRKTISKRIPIVTTRPAIKRITELKTTSKAVAKLNAKSEILNFTRLCQQVLQSSCWYYPEKYLHDCTYQISCRQPHIYAQRVIVLRPEMWSHRFKFKYSTKEETIEVPQSLRSTNVIPCRTKFMKAGGYCLESNCYPFLYPEWNTYDSLPAIKGGLGDDQNYGCMVSSEDSKPYLKTSQPCDNKSAKNCTQYSVTMVSCTNPFPQLGGEPCSLGANKLDVPFQIKKCDSCNVRKIQYRKPCLGFETFCGHSYFSTAHRKTSRSSAQSVAAGYVDDFEPCCTNDSTQNKGNVCYSGHCVPYQS